MEKLKSDFRVIVHNPKVKGLHSCFEKFSNDIDARSWAINYGLKLHGDCIEFAKKSNICFNHYDTLEFIYL